MKTLQIGNDWFGERQGGLNRVFVELLKSLPNVGVEVRGLVAGERAVLSETGGTVVPFAPRTAPILLRLAKARSMGLDLLREYQPDLVVSHFALYTFSVLDRLGDIPLAIHFQGPWAAESGVEGNSSIGSRGKALIESAVYRRAQRLIVLSEAFQGELVRRYRVSEEKVRVVPAGVDVDWFNDRLPRDDARRKLNWPTDRPIVLAIRRQVRRMGLENLIDAILLVRQRVPDVLLHLGGTGPIAHELTQRTEDKGLKHHVRQLGRIDDSDLPLVYRAADISIVPTQFLEGFGMITLESLASGTPVLVTPVGGLPEIVRPFAPQCVLEDARTETMADALSRFLSGCESLPTSENCRKYACANFTWPTIASRVKDVYSEAIR